MVFGAGPESSNIRNLDPLGNEKSLKQNGPPFLWQRVSQFWASLDAGADYDLPLRLYVTVVQGMCT